MAEHVQVLIIGAGTAGLSAAIYAARQTLSVLVIENKMTGGQIVNSPDVENYPGIEAVSGYEFTAVSYTHLDVYKRQYLHGAEPTLQFYLHQRGFPE